MTRDELLNLCFGKTEFLHPDLTLEMTELSEGVIAHVDVYWRTLHVAGEPIDVAAVAQVCTAPAYRRRGYAGALVSAAHAVAVRHGVRFAALFGHLHYYARLGYERTPVETLLVAALTSEPWPSGPIDYGEKW